MQIFQKSVTNKYLKNLDTAKVEKAFKNFQKFYGDKLRLANIMQLKEENYQEGFLREIFVETLGYTINPDKNYNLTTEFKNLNDARKADGAILKNGKAIGVIELKSTKTKDLESIKEQAFGYKNNQPDCKYVITSNFQKLRFYIDNTIEYEEFDLFKLDKNRFKLLYLLLSQESIFSDLPEKLKEETKFYENDISAKLYKDYKHFKDEIFKNLVKNNPQYDKLTLFKKSQKLLDRFLFIFFAEDSGLIPPNAVSKIVEQWKTFIEEDEYFTLYSRFQKLFSHLDKGHIYKKWGEIPAYNGGLFRSDEILDNSDLIIDDEILEKDSLKLSTYDFNSEVDVNILGHIFEHSLNEIEEITAELHGAEIDKKKSKRKKDGVFYTPKYITKYIVENTVGTLCKEKKAELQINNLLIDDTYRRKGGKINEKGKKLFKTLNNYKDWLLTLKILDPACGSGAFLNQTLDFLIAEHKQADDLIAELTGENLRLFDTDKAILENNIYGVDINEESVEIAKLSLWLRTAQRGRPLSDLSGNIKCGNSLIDDPEIAGSKAFDWEKEFPHVFNPKIKEKNYQKAPEIKPDYVSLIKEKTQKAEKLAKEALEISKQIYKYAEKIKQANETQQNYGIKGQGGFDVVLGNPPYVGQTKSSIYENYKWNSDLYLMFFEKIFKGNVLKKEGIFSFITPRFFAVNKNCADFRNFILTKVNLINLVETAPFAEAETECLISVIKYSEPDLDIIVEEDKNNDFRQINIIKKKNCLSNDYNEIQTFLKENTISILNKILKSSVKLKEISLSKRGMEIGKKDFYSENTNIKVLVGYDVKKYSVNFQNNYITEINKQFKRLKVFFNQENLIFLRRVANGLIASVSDKEKYSFNKNLYGIKVNKYFNYKYILALLNSTVLNFYYKKKFSTKKIDLFPEIQSYLFQALPIKEISKDLQQPFIEKANLMLSLNKELQEKSEKFIKRIKLNLEIQKITNKLQNFYNFDFKTFILELKKQKIKLNLKEQDEWEDYFDNFKIEINSIQAQINQTNKEIDKMVYELYELTKEEIEIMENSVKP